MEEAQSEIKESKRDWVKTLGFTLLGLILASGIFAAGYFFGQSRQVVPTPAVVPTPTAQITPTPTPTSIPVLTPEPTAAEKTECEKWREECAKEGESRCTACGRRNCCSGLVSRHATHPWRTETNEVVCLENLTAYICVKCGDGICGRGEDWCICPEDCKKPSPESLELFISPLTP